MSDLLSQIEECLTPRGVMIQKEGRNIRFEARSVNRRKFEFVAELQPNNNALLRTYYMPALEEIERKSPQHKQKIHDYLKILLTRSNDGVYYQRDEVTGQIFIEAKLYESTTNFCKHFFDVCVGIADLREYLEDDLRAFIDA